MSAKYYIRPRREENPKRWQGPFDAAQLKDLADRRMFSKELHEYSEDRLNWLPARKIWTELFPTSAKVIVSQVPPISLAVKSKPAVSSDGKKPPKTSDGVDQRSASDAAAPGGEEWFYASNGRQEGPVNLEQIQKLAARKTLQATDLVWSPRFGNQWVEASTVAEIFPPVELTAPRSLKKMSARAILAIVAGVIVTILIVLAAYLIIGRIRF